MENLIEQQREQAKEIGLYNSNWIHPTYEGDFEDTPMSLRNAKECLESDRFSTAVKMTECLRREWRDLTTEKNNFIGAALDLYKILVSEVSKQGIALAADFVSNPDAWKNGQGKKIALGDKKDEKYYVPGYGYVEYSQYFVLSKIYRLKKAWTDRTIAVADDIVAGRYIRELTDEEAAKRNKKIANIRKLWLANGTAQQMIHEFKLNVADFDLKDLTVGFLNEKGEDPVIEKKEKAKEIKPKLNWFQKFVKAIFG